MKSSRALFLCFLCCIPVDPVLGQAHGLVLRFSPKSILVLFKDTILLDFSSGLPIAFLL